MNDREDLPLCKSPGEGERIELGSIAQKTAIAAELALAKVRPDPGPIKTHNKNELARLCAAGPVEPVQSLECLSPLFFSQVRPLDTQCTRGHGSWVSEF